MKPPRTFGLSLAILTSTLLFSILPLLQIIVPLLIQYRISSANVAPQGDEPGVTPFAVGSQYTGITDFALFAQIGLSVLFLAVAWLAWRGRPAWSRWLMMGAVLGLVALTAAGALLQPAPSLATGGIDSGQQLQRSLVWGQVIVAGFVALYVLWYMNRAPARAFYRGYYLRHDEAVAASGALPNDATKG